MITLADRYELGDKIGTGGMGNVYLAEDTLTGNTVAIKALKESLINDDPTVLHRFLREADALRQLAHPNIVKILDSFEHEQQHFIVMEYLPGGSLGNRVKKNGPLPVEEAVAICLELADALTRSHHLGIIHRDIKPANVLLADDNTPRLTDFGVAQISQASMLTSGDVVMGTIPYLSPEALNGEPQDTRADIWAFGVMMYELLTGIRPFRGDQTAQLIRAIVMDSPDPDLITLRPDTPAALVNLIYQMLVKDSNNRIASVRQVGAALEAIQHGRPTELEEESVALAIAQQQTKRVSETNLPIQSTHFVGREHELAELSKLLNNHRLITIVAPGGMGKTRLALEAASQQTASFPDGVYLVELAPLTDPDNIPVAIADSIGYLIQQYGRSTHEQIVDFLSDKTLLLVLDNFEHLLSGASHITDILRATPNVHFIVTSRQRLNYTSETVFKIEGMEFPDRVAPGDALEFSAVKLFVQSAQRVQTGFRLDDDNLEYVVRICRLIRGMPLGIVLAAAWLDMLTPEEVVNEIGASIEFLATDMTDLPERQRSLRAVFDYSWSLLSDQEQVILGKLALFRDSFSVEGAREVANVTLQILKRLSNKSWISRDMATRRYQIHALAQSYVAEKRSPEDKELHLTYVAYYERYAAANVDEIQALETELRNILHAVEMVLRSNQIEHAVNMMVSLVYKSNYFELRGYDPMLTKLLHKTIKTAEEVEFIDPLILCYLLGKQGNHYAARGEAEAALQNYQRVYDLAGQLVDVERQVMALCGMSGVYSKLNDQDEALRYLDLAQDKIDPVTDASLKHTLQLLLLEHQGYCYAVVLEDFDTARTIFEQGVTLAEEVHDVKSLFFALLNLGAAEYELHRNKDALLTLDRALKLAEDSKNLTHIALAKENMGYVYHALDELDTALQYIYDARRTFQKLGLASKVVEVNSFIQSKNLPLHDDNEQEN